MENLSQNLFHEEKGTCEIEAFPFPYHQSDLGEQRLKGSHFDPALELPMD